VVNFTQNLVTLKI